MGDCSPGCAFGFQHFHHFVGGGGGSVLFEIAGNHKDGVPSAYLGHAIRAAGGSGEVGDEDYEYQVQFSAREEIQLTDGTKKTNHFKINATVSPDGKVSAFNMSKINAAE